MSDRKIIYFDDAIDAIYKCTDYYIGNLPIMIDKADAYKALDTLPPTQSEQETGEWKPYTYVDPDDWYQDKEIRYRCSKCGEEVINKSNFCPNCGTKMHKEERREEE